MQGILSFFDILGYQSYLENNTSSESALEVLELITSIPHVIKNDFRQKWIEASPDQNIATEIDNSLKMLIFSDTIVLAIEYPENADNTWKETCLAYMIMSSARLMARMFVFGLPMRGVIHTGDFIIKDICLAGKAVVEAYKICNSLNLSAFVISKELEIELKTYQMRQKPLFQTHNFGIYFVKYLTQLRDNVEAKYLHFNWFSYLDFSDDTSYKNNIDSFVFNHFWAHQKDISMEANNKVFNTIKLFRKFMSVE